MSIPTWETVCLMISANLDFNLIVFDSQSVSQEYLVAKIFQRLNVSLEKCRQVTLKLKNYKHGSRHRIKFLFSSIKYIRGLFKFYQMQDTLCPCNRSIKQGSWVFNYVNREIISASSIVLLSLNYLRPRISIKTLAV